MIHKINGKEFNFMFSKPLELLYSLIAVSFKDEFLKDVDEKEKANMQSILKMVENMQGRLSSYIRWELQYFFHKYACIYSTTMGVTIYMSYLNHNPEVNTIEEIFEIIDKSDEYTMLSYAIESIFFENNNKNIREVYDWNSVQNNPNELMNIIKKLELSDEDMNQKLIESIENARETKQRYIMLLKQFYEKAYMPFEEEIYKAIVPSIEQYEREFLSNPERFCRKYFVKDINVFGSKVVIHISFSKFRGSDYWSSKKGTECIIFGSDTWRFITEEPERERILNFLKAISDKRRMSIIELLAEKPWYVNEIAEEIGMSAATTSYHLTNLQELGIVDFERCEHRFYYYLNKDKLRELFNESMKIYLHE
ncbi:metalloregulator ArsR/SmtB family transcription factor [Tissierella carlieri]|uniref:ArsR/SmtB family transcription factor n=1 Tax=Tissierella carlieri TaxID=689904 RepID=UPI001C127867|nr:metalloregulator ArsR/SmtB family transcription factor [Tissierella carlieri]MBU5312143.1 metalloregulator ArsR/SmtB family transcription factor [Tissierella carlieri]